MLTRDHVFSARRLHGPSRVAAAAVIATTTTSTTITAPASTARVFSSSAAQLRKPRDPRLPKIRPHRRPPPGPPPEPLVSSPPRPTPTRGPPPVKTMLSEPQPENPLDLSPLLAAYRSADLHYKSQLHSILHGGRFDPSSLGALPVLVRPEPGDGGAAAADAAPTSFPLRELAQVVPRSGRAISLLVHDRAYIKPIMSAVQVSPDFNQQPQRSPDNDLELLLRVELDRREDLVRRVKEAAQAWRDALRRDRTKHDKVLKEWRKTGAVLPDLVRRAEDEVQKLQDRKMKEVAAEESMTLMQLERRG